MGDGHPTDRLHGLNRDRCLEIKARKDLEDSEGDENSEGVHLVEGDIADDKRNQGAEIAKGPGKLHLVIVISPKPHRHVISTRYTRTGLHLNRDVDL